MPALDGRGWKLISQRVPPGLGGVRKVWGNTVPEQRWFSSEGPDLAPEKRRVLARNISHTVSGSSRATGDIMGHSGVTGKHLNISNNQTSPHP